jgi:L-ascorbate metabolism protein UlaG (beta-lactamase superfamily)
MLQRFTWFRQSAYLWRGDGFNVYIDPWGVTIPDPADVIFITHAHADHFSPEDIQKIQKSDTQIYAPSDVANELSGHVTPVKPGDSFTVGAIAGQAVPAYNIVEHRLQAHPKANNWVGYLLTLSDSTYYHAGDTDHAPELSAIRADVAFLPIGGDPYVMDPLEAAGLAKAINPQVAVPMHYGFVIGSPSDGDRFVKECDPIKVELLTPTNPFERT